MSPTKKPTLLLDYVRSIGLPCKGLQAGRHVGWTTEERIATLAREHGASVIQANALSDGLKGWEVSFREGAEVIEQVSP